MNSYSQQSERFAYCADLHSSTLCTELHDITSMLVNLGRTFPWYGTPATYQYSHIFLLTVVERSETVEEKQFFVSNEVILAKLFDLQVRKGKI